MDSAMTFFSEKGYLATSIQNIADDCGIAKGSLYKFFQSKEDLFIEIHISQQQRLYEQIESIRADDTLSLRDIFIRETEYLFGFCLDNNFLMREIKQLTVQDGRMAPFLLRLRANLLNYNRESLIRVLGEGLESNIWDLVIIYNGIVREFLFLLVFENKPLIIRDIAVFIADRMEDVAAGMRAKKPTPILQDESMSEYVKSALLGESTPIAAQRTDLLETLKSTIKELSITNSAKTELHEAALLLQEEFECKQPKSVLIQALLNFLANEHGLKDVIRRLDKLTVKSRKCGL